MEPAGKELNSIALILGFAAAIVAVVLIVPTI